MENLDHSLVGAICIKGIVTKLAQFFRIDVSNLPSIKPLFLDEIFIRNSKQFTLLNKKWVWKHDLSDQASMHALFKEIEEYQEEAQPQQA